MTIKTVISLVTVLMPSFCPMHRLTDSPVNLTCFPIMLISLLQVWIDPKLQWNPEKYGGLHVIRLPYDSIWRPDILLYNKYASFCHVYLASFSK